MLGLEQAMASSETIYDIGKRSFREKNARFFPYLIAAAILYEIALAAGTVYVVANYGPGEDGGYLKLAAIIFVIPLMTYALWLGVFLARARTEFWKAFAKKQGFTYDAKADVKKELAAMMFFKSNERFSPIVTRSIQNVVRGSANGRPCRLFEYTFTKNKGKHGEYHTYTVFEFTFAGTFPHLYLNRKGDGYDLDPGTPLRLPAEFEKEFELYAPEQYEVEAFEIFTTDFLAHLIDSKWPFDIEFVENRVIIYCRGLVASEAELTREWEAARALVARLAPQLDRMRLERVGTHAPVLK